MNRRFLATRVSRSMLVGGLFALILAGTVPGMPAVRATALHQSGGLLATVKARGFIRVSNTQADPPWSFLNKQNQLVGYDVDVARQLARRMGVGRVEFVRGNFDTFIPGLQAGKWDIVISGMTPTAARRTQVDFSNPYQVNGVSIFVSQSNTSIKTRADLKNRSIAVTLGTTQEQWVRANVPGAQVKTYDNPTLALKDVAIGRVDAALFSRFIGAYLARKNGLKVKPLRTLLEVEVNAMTFPRKQPAFKRAVNAALSRMIRDGSLTKISRRWLGGLDMAAQLKKLKRS